jgi:quercetin dioxygenase-like cupin family protein
MLIGKSEEQAGLQLVGEDIRDVVKRVLVGPDDGWDGWVMRLFDVGPGGHTPRHAHGWPHINYILNGRGLLRVNGDERPIETGSFAVIPAQTEHQFFNTGVERLRFLCIVPAEGDQ